MYTYISRYSANSIHDIDNMTPFEFINTFEELTYIIGKESGSDD